jgi:hypothetical protein
MSGVTEALEAWRAARYQTLAAEREVELGFDVERAEPVERPPIVDKQV